MSSATWAPGPAAGTRTLKSPSTSPSRGTYPRASVQNANALLMSPTPMTTVPILSTSQWSRPAGGWRNGRREGRPVRGATMPGAGPGAGRAGLGARTTYRPVTFRHDGQDSRCNRLGHHGWRHHRGGRGRRPRRDPALSRPRLCREDAGGDRAVSRQARGEGKARSGRQSRSRQPDLDHVRASRSGRLRPRARVRRRRFATKQQLFSELDQICDERTILATNTSTLPVVEIAMETGRPGKCAASTSSTRRLL